MLNVEQTTLAFDDRAKDDPLLDAVESEIEPVSLGNDVYDSTH
jgi:hypothetical protein